VDHAVDKLIQALERTDGCALRGSPDTAGGSIRKDYITNCDDQASVYPLLVDALQALEATQP
jgi:glycosylphosphatidylinositol phospholipase D